MDTDLSKYRNYFVMNGKAYFTGTVCVLKWFDEYVKMPFICYNTQKNTYTFKMPNGTRWTLTEKMLHNSLKEITNQRDNSVHMPRLVKLPDKYIDGLTFGWMWYIFLMAISILFKDAIGLLVFISYVFFSWRHKKIKKEGTHVEW